MKKILFVFLYLLPSIIFSQWLLPPYKLEPVDTLIGSVLAKSHIFNKKSFDYVCVKNMNLVKFNKEIKIVRYDEKIVNISFGKNRKIISNIFVGDIDNDSLSEIVFGVTGKNLLDVYVYDSNKKSKLLSIRIPKKYFNGKILVIPDYRPNFIYIVIASVLPHSKSIRGIFKINVNTNKIVWKKLFADVVSDYFLFEKNKKKLLALFSYARNEKFFYANGKFIDKRHNPHLFVDRNAKDFSCDTVATVSILDTENGDLIFRKIIGPAGTKTNVFGKNANGYDLILSLKQFSLSKKSIDRLVGFKIKDFSFTPLIEYPHKHENKQVVNISSKTIVQTTDTTAIVVRNNKLTEVKLKFPKFTKVNDFYKTELGCIFITRSYRSFQIYNLKYELLTKIDQSLALDIFEPSKNIYVGKFHINGERNTIIFQLKRRVFLEKISSEAYYYLLLILLSLSLTLFLMWSGTLIILLTKIKKQNRNLKLMTTKLLQAEKLSALGTIASSIAHQINSPLGVILNATERLMRQGIENKNLTLIQNAGNRINVIIQKFLISTHVGKNESGITFNEVFDKWYELFSKDFSEQGINLNIKIKNGDVILPLKWNELNEMINNPMFNARDSVIKSNPPGEREITLITEIKDNAFHIIIKDNGMGFDKKYIKHGIKLFKTTKERGKGTGLGLWIIETILERNNGQIILKNDEKGAIVIIIIPVSKNGSN